MITVSLSKSAKDGSSYFDIDDGYYAAPPGASQWYGHGARELGLVGEVNKMELDIVLHGYDPRTGGKLVANANAEDILDANGKVVKRGRVAYIDVHAAVPKSASILALVDPQIEQAHNRAVEKIIARLEADYTFTRRDKSGIIETVKSDNLTVARINHYESRDLDPQLHSHLVVMNLTHGEDGKWRSIEAGKIYRDQQYLGQIYRNELAKELRKIGYEIDVTDPKKGFFEVKGINLDLLETYSKRRKSIVKKLEEYEEKGQYKDLSDRDKAQQACLATRRKKQGIKPDKLREKVEAELADIGQSLAAIRETALRYGTAAAAEPPHSAEHCVRSAIDDVMDKQAAATEKAVIDQALKGGMGYYTADELAAVLRHQPDWEVLGPVAGDRYPTAYYTTTETRHAERNVVNYAMRDRGRYGRALAADTLDKHLDRIAAEGKRLSNGQLNVVRMVCSTCDRVSVIQGDAGAGKTFAMETVREILGAEGIKVRGFAPTGKASEELNAAGVEAMTVHKYLESPTIQSEAGQGEVWLVDESGMIGSRRLHEFLKNADEKQARVILIGDTKQFQSVEQGKIFQSLQNRRVVRKTEITEVKRQKTEHAKIVVKAIKDEDFETAFRTLDRHGGLKEIASRDERIKHIVDEYIRDRKKGTESVVLTANNADKDEINGNIRSILAKDGIVQSGEAYEMFQKYDVNNIAKTFGRAYTDGQIIVTRRDCGDIPRGTQATITKIDTDNDTVNVKYYNKEKKPVYATIDLRQNAATFDVYNRYRRHFGVGDSIIFTKNDKRVGVSNGQTGTITEIDNNGDAKIKVGKKTVECNLHNRGDKGYTYIDYAYCLTNHKSQGSTYDRVIVNADVSRQKTNYNAFYVQATRARYDITIVTDNKDKLAEQATIHENKISTLDEMFEDFAKKQLLRVAEIRAEDAEFAKNAEKANRDRIESRIISDLNAIQLKPKWYNTNSVKDTLVKLQSMKYNITLAELDKMYIERYGWTIHNPPQRDRNGNYIAARLGDRQNNNTDDGYIVAQPQENGKITYRACIGIPKDTAKLETGKKISESFDGIRNAQARIDAVTCNWFLLEFVKKVEKELEKQRELAKKEFAKTQNKDSGISLV